MGRHQITGLTPLRMWAPINDQEAAQARDEADLERRTGPTPEELDEQAAQADWEAQALRMEA